VALLVVCESPGLNLGNANETAMLEYVRSKRNSWCRGEIRWYHGEHQKRRQLTGTLL